MMWYVAAFIRLVLRRAHSARLEGWGGLMLRDAHLAVRSSA